MWRNSYYLYQHSEFLTNPRWKFHNALSPFQEMVNLASIKNLRNILSCCSNHQQKLLLIRDPFIKLRWHDVWENSFSNHNTLNFGILGDKIHNILWQLSNLNLSRNCSIKLVFILGGTNNIDHNSPEEIADGLISSRLSVQAQCQNAKVVIIPLLPCDIKSSLRQ